MNERTAGLRCYQRLLHVLHTRDATITPADDNINLQNHKKYIKQVFYERSYKHWNYESDSTVDTSHSIHLSCQSTGEKSYFRQANLVFQSIYFRFFTFLLIL